MLEPKNARVDLEKWTQTSLNIWYLYIPYTFHLSVAESLAGKIQEDVKCNQMFVQSPELRI